MQPHTYAVKATDSMGSCWSPAADAVDLRGPAADGADPRNPAIYQQALLFSRDTRNLWE